jgi:hypothetical protein
VLAPPVGRIIILGRWSCLWRHSIDDWLAGGREGNDKMAATIIIMMAAIKDGGIREGRQNVNVAKPPSWFRVCVDQRGVPANPYL